MSGTKQKSKGIGLLCQVQYGHRRGSALYRSFSQVSGTGVPQAFSHFCFLTSQTFYHLTSAPLDFVLATQPTIRLSFAHSLLELAQKPFQLRCTYKPHNAMLLLCIPRQDTHLITEAAHCITGADYASVSFAKDGGNGRKSGNHSVCKEDSRNLENTF